MMIRISQPSGPLVITISDGRFTVTGSSPASCASLHRQLQAWWQHGILTAVPDRGKKRTVTVLQQRLTPDHPRFLDTVIRRLRARYSYQSVQIHYDETQRIDEQLTLALTTAGEIPSLQPVVEKIRSALPKLTIDQKKELVGHLFHTT